MDYKFRKNAGALNEAAAPPQAPQRHTAVMASLDQDSYATTHAGDPGVYAQTQMVPPNHQPAAAGQRGLDRRGRAGGGGLFRYTVRDGEQVMVTRADGRVTIIRGPARFWRWGATVETLAHYVAHPGEFLIIRFRDGRQQHLLGPAHVWLDPTIHLAIEREDTLHIAAKEAVVVYSQDPQGGVTRRVVHGPATFMPEPGEWLHTFAWHGTKGASGGYQKVPNGMIFQKLWLMPDQMYHDVPDVRTADDAVLTVRLMIFFVLEDLPRMLETTHDPIGDFINAATSDVIAFTGRHAFESFKEHTQALNELSSYGQLVARAEQCGYRITKVVYRGYGAPEALQRMHDEAIESRTRLGLERATREQAQDLEDFTQERALARAERQRQAVEQSLAHELHADRQRRAAEIEDRTQRRAAERDEERRDAAQQSELQRAAAAGEEARLAGLKALGVDLTAYLTRQKVDRLIEVKAPGPVHVESR